MPVPLQSARPAPDRLGNGLEAAMTRENKLAILCALVMVVGLPYLYVRGKPDREKRAQEDRISQRQADALWKDLAPCRAIPITDPDWDELSRECTGKVIDKYFPIPSFKNLKNPDVISEGPK